MLKQSSGNPPLGMAMIGSPDDLAESAPVDNFQELTDTLIRRQLVDLYFLNSKLLKAYTQKISITPYGLSGLLEFQNALNCANTDQTTGSESV